MLTVAILLASLCQTPAVPVSPVITFPDLVQPVTPKPVPSGAIPVLDADVIYVLQSTANCIVLSSPPGLVTITPEAGPLRIKGRFIDDPGKTKSQTFKGPFLWTIEPLMAGRCEIIVVPLVGVKVESDIKRRMIDVLGPRPPPDPDPEPPKPPTPDGSSPFADAGFRALIVYETKDLAKMPTAQEQVIFSKEIRDYLNTRTVLGSDGKTHEWRIYDQNIDVSQDAKVWQDTMKRDRKSVPWIYVGDGKRGFEGPLPADVGSTLTLLKKFGGA